MSARNQLFHHPFTNRKLLSFVTSILAIVSAHNACGAVGNTISVNFLGRNGSGTNGPVGALNPADLAGVVPVTNWNNIDNAYGNINMATFVKNNLGQTNNAGTTVPLVDSTGAVTPVTLTFNADDSWNNDTDLSTNTTANAKMMKGIIKMGNGKTNEIASFTFNHVPDGQYDLYIYTDSNNTNVAINIDDNNKLQNYYTIGTHQFLDTSTFIQATNSNPSGTRDVGNYVKLSNLATYGGSTLGFTAKYVSGGDGLGIAGLQLVNVGGPLPPAVIIPPTLVAAAPAKAAGGKLRGEYWKRAPYSIAADGATNSTDRIDNQLNGFGTPTGTFTATEFSYTGNDLTGITNWLGADGKSFVGTTNNLDDGAFRFSGFINVTNAGQTVKLGTTSDDGSRITIGGIDIINNDSSHGGQTFDTNVVFAAAGLYPIEITYFNGDWTSDGTGANLNHSGNPDPSVHGGASFALRVDGTDATNSAARAIFYSDAGVVVVGNTFSVGAPLAKTGSNLNGEYWKRPPYSIPLDGNTNSADRIDKLLSSFGPPSGTFTATQFNYTGNDLTGITNWLGVDAKSFAGTTNNLDDAGFRFHGYINIANAGTTVKLGTTSDDGSRITIGGLDIINNDGSHGGQTIDTNVVFESAGLYPIEVTYFNGDWTSDGTGAKLNHSGNPDPSVHGGANFTLRVGGTDATNAASRVLFSATGPAVLVPPQLATAPAYAVTPAKTNGGASLYGEYWKRPPYSIPGDGATNPKDRLDEVIKSFGEPTGTFQATKMVYTGNDLTPVRDWLGSDAGSFAGVPDNLDDAAFRFTGLLNVPAPGTVKLGTTSDDGSRITIGGIDIINNDSSHGGQTFDTNVVFAAAGLYPIEITYYNGDWTSDGTGANLNHSGNPDPSVHGGANFTLRIGGTDATNSAALAIFSTPNLPAPATLLSFQMNEGSGPITYDLINKLPGILGQALDTNHLPAITTDSPSGKTNDLAVSFSEGSTNGTQALVVDDHVSPVLAFPTNQAFTIETWINIDTNDTRVNEGLVSYGRTAASNVGYKLGLSNQELLFTLFGVVDLSSGIKVPLGEWHHVAAVWTPKQGVEFFLDGTSVTNVPNTQFPKPYASNWLTIGAENVGATNFATTFQGMMDRVRITKGALTAAQLDSVAASPKPVSTNTVVDYNFDGGTVPFPNAATANRPAVSSPPNTWPTWTANTVSGKPGDYALQFAKGTEVDVPNPNNAVQLNSTSPDFTIQAWVNTAGNPTNRMVLYYNNGPGGALALSIDTNRTVFVTTLGIKDQPSNAKIPDDKNWHHIAVVHQNKKELRFYVDGVLEDTKPYTGGVLFSRTNAVFYLGRDNAPGYQYVGLLDRLIVSKGALTEAELDYPGGGTPPTLVDVGAIDGGVGVVFNVAVDAATALNPGNYTVTGTTVTNVTFIAPNYVLLHTSATPTNGFKVTVDKVTGLGGDPMAGAETLTAPPIAGATITDGLVAYWSFDGHLLDSVGVLDGSARGKVPVGFTNGPSANFGKALELNGTNYVEITGSSNVLQFASGSLSIAGWFKVDNFDKSWQALISKGEGADPGNYRIARRSAENTIAYAGGTGEGPDDTPNINDGKWHHFVAVTDATTARFGTALYIDGEMYSVNTNKAVLKAGTANLFIGENPESLNRQWEGAIDDIGLWNRVLAPEEIAVLYNNGQGTPVSALPGVQAPLPANRPYTVGLNFGADYLTNGVSKLAPSQVAGALPQANWNDMNGQNGTNITGIVADTDYETAEATPVTVSWQSNNMWSTIGASGGTGPTNNKFPGADLNLMAGYLDTGAPSTTLVTITNIPPELTSNGYDVYVYALGDTSGRGGGYRILEAGTTNVLKDYVKVQGTTNISTYVEAPIDPKSTNWVAGNYMVFTNLTASAITVEATTDHNLGFGSTHRAPINAIQLVAAPGPTGPTVTIARTAGGVTLAFEGTLQSADSIAGPWTDVPGTSPITVTASDKAKFYRSKQ